MPAIPLTDIPNAPRGPGGPQLRSPQSGAIDTVNAPIGEIRQAFARAGAAAGRPLDYSQLRIPAGAMESQYEGLRGVGRGIQNLGGIINEINQRTIQARDTENLVQARMDVRTGMQQFLTSLPSRNDYENWGKEAGDIINGVTEQYGGRFLSREGKLAFEETMNRFQMNYQLQVATDGARLAFNRGKNALLDEFQWAVDHGDINGAEAMMKQYVAGNYGDQREADSRLRNARESIKESTIQAQLIADPTQVTDEDLADLPTEVQIKLGNQRDVALERKESDFFKETLNQIDAQNGIKTKEGLKEWLDPEVNPIAARLSEPQINALEKRLEGFQIGTEEEYQKLYDELLNYSRLDDPYQLTKVKLESKIYEQFDKSDYAKTLEGVLKDSYNGNANLIIKSGNDLFETYRKSGIFGDVKKSPKTPADFEDEAKSRTEMAPLKRKFLEAVREGKVEDGAVSVAEMVEKYRAAKESQRIYERNQRFEKQYPTGNFKLDYRYGSPTSNNTYYSIGTKVGGEDELNDGTPSKPGTNQGYTSTGKNLSYGSVAVGSERLIGTVFRDETTGDIFIANDRHGNKKNPTALDIYARPGTYHEMRSANAQRLVPIDKISRSEIPGNVREFQELRQKYNPDTETDWYGPFLG